MKKMVFGVLAFIVTLTVAGGIQQYSSKPDIVGQQAKTVEQVNLYLPFQSERGFSIFVPQNSTKLEK